MKQKTWFCIRLQFIITQYILIYIKFCNRIQKIVFRTPMGVATKSSYTNKCIIKATLLLPSR